MRESIVFHCGRDPEPCREGKREGNLVQQPGGQRCRRADHQDGWVIWGRASGGKAVQSGVCQPYPVTVGTEGCWETRRPGPLWCAKWAPQPFVPDLKLNKEVSGQLREVCSVLLSCDFWLLNPWSSLYSCPLSGIGTFMQTLLESKPLASWHRLGHAWWEVGAADNPHFCVL